jgi:hypothetical protein
MGFRLNTRDLPTRTPHQLVTHFPPHTTHMYSNANLSQEGESSDSEDSAGGCLISGGCLVWGPSSSDMLSLSANGVKRHVMVLILYLLP